MSKVGVEIQKDQTSMELQRYYNSHTYSWPPLRSHTQIPDADFDAKLKNDSQLKDASRATIMECDDMECAQMECVQDNRGNWECEGGLEGEERKTTKTVLMTSQDDDE